MRRSNQLVFGADLVAVDDFRIVGCLYFRDAGQRPRVEAAALVSLSRRTRRASRRPSACSSKPTFGVTSDQLSTNVSCVPGAPTTYTPLAARKWIELQFLIVLGPAQAGGHAELVGESIRALTEQRHRLVRDAREQIDSNIHTDVVGIAGAAEPQRRRASSDRPRICSRQTAPRRTRRQRQRLERGKRADGEIRLAVLDRVFVEEVRAEQPGQSIVEALPDKLQLLAELILIVVVDGFPEGERRVIAIAGEQRLELAIGGDRLDRQQRPSPNRPSARHRSCRDRSRSARPHRS